MTKILVANLGSTSFKYKLLEMSDAEHELASGACERIGQSMPGTWQLKVGDEIKSGEVVFEDHAAAVELHLSELIECGVIASVSDVAAIGFKAVHGGPISGAVRVDDEVLETMARFNVLAPAHNPPYIAAMKALKRVAPDTEQVAVFETAYHQTIPAARQVYGVPHEWYEQYGIRRYGFHGASHSYIASRMNKIDPAAKRIINCHLGGSCSICAIKDGKSVANSFGTTPQSGVLHNNRTGDLDVFSVLAMRKHGLSEEDIFSQLGKQGGLLGISGLSADIRDIEEAAATGHEQAQLAIDAFVESCRHYIGAYLVALGGMDAITFTGGIGQHGKQIRAAILKDLGFAGIVMDDVKNKAADGNDENRIDHADSAVRIWVLPTNEELMVARQTVAVLQKQNI
ncbi:acetate/propionate family kinase [Poriferisphaera sp. WC338]|uniref:acetate/propionate family kinase n=1 Tax=Poriferisphaera sp. WC338 TaxID=3425129 RepID=UPI003D818CFE